MAALEGRRECWLGLLWEVSLFPRSGGGGGDHGKDCLSDLTT